MLLGEDFGGRHQRHLITRLQRLQGGHRRHHRFTRPHIPLNQAQHRLGLTEIVGNFVADTHLRPGRGKAQVAQKLLRQRSGFSQGGRTLRAQAFAQTLLRQLMGQQFFKRQAVLCPVMAQGEFFNVCIGRWLVEIANRLIQRRQLIVFGQLARQPVRQAAWPQHRQALQAQLAQALLSQAFSGGVDRGQRGVDRRWFIARNGTVLRVVDFQPRRAGTRFAIATHFSAALQAFLLRITEVVETQAQATRTVIDAHQQAAALAHDHIGANHPPFDHRILTGA